MSLLSNSLRVAVIGNVDSGKSSLVGVLTRNVLDDGLVQEAHRCNGTTRNVPTNPGDLCSRGAARTFVFHHKHEKDTGRSSTVSCEIMGFEGVSIGLSV
jgi:GTPase